ncbi:MAG: hypothetical protein WDZ77_01540 [Candidatus Pacearchaeota archaeon]
MTFYYEVNNPGQRFYLVAGGYDSVEEAWEGLEVLDHLLLDGAEINVGESIYKEKNSGVKDFKSWFIETFAHLAR